MPKINELSEGSETLSEILASSATTVVPNEIVIGTVTKIAPNGQPVVEYVVDGVVRNLQAITTQALTNSHISRQVAMMFVNASIEQPIIMGLIRNSLDTAIETFELGAEVDGSSDEGGELNVDGKKVVIEGKEEVVLKCGSSSITLTKSGKILLRGKYLVSRSSGVNRILGGSVQVN